MLITFYLGYGLETVQIFDLDINGDRVPENSSAELTKGREWIMTFIRYR